LAQIVAPDILSCEAGFAAFLARSPATRRPRTSAGFISIGTHAPAMNSTVAVLRFFFTHTLDRPDLARKLIRLPHLRKLPTVLALEEIGAGFQRQPGCWERDFVRQARAFAMIVGLCTRGRAMADKPNFVLVPDDSQPPVPVRPDSLLARLRTTVITAVTAIASVPAALRSALDHAEPPAETGLSARPRLVFAVDATASREPAWAAARQVTDVVVKALPGELDVALAVHGGSRVHTFTAFTNDANTLRDSAAGVACEAGLTRLLPILSAGLKQPGVRVVIYIGDVFEESVVQGSPAGGRHGRAGHQVDRAA